VAWLVLVVSGLLETVWAVALARSGGLSRLGPSLLFAVAVTLSLVGLAFALRTVPVGTGYAVWVGIGAAGTAVYGMLALHEPATPARVLCILLVVAGVAGLRLMHAEDDRPGHTTGITD
jgi:quaternary ammonium compound-resistance protein SugE